MSATSKSSKDRDDGGFVVDKLKLRDYFAARALVLLSHADMLASLRDQCKGDRTDPADAIAEFCGAVADAMLKERAK